MAKVMWQTDLTIAEINEKIEASEDIFKIKYKFWKRKKIGEKQLLNVCFGSGSEAYIWEWPVEFSGYMWHEDDKTCISGRMKLYIRINHIISSLVGISMFWAGLYTLFFTYKDGWIAWASVFGLSFFGALICCACLRDANTNKSALALLKETLEATDIETK